jgi:hypothetical protein
MTLKNMQIEMWDYLCSLNSTKGNASILNEETGAPLNSPSSPDCNGHYSALLKSYLMTQEMSSSRLTG